MLQLLLSTVILIIQYASFGFATTVPSPVSFNFGTDFFGDDGLWSAAQIRVGSDPEQYVWVYPNTLSPETWVIGPGGCDNQLACQKARGGLFTSKNSSSYVELGTYELGFNFTGLTIGYGDYGLDNITISDTVSAPGQVIATVTDPAIWLGQLGLSVQEPRFTDETNQLSLISSLVQNESVIPSHSFGYTAGAHYALKSVPGSLVLGGIDTTRFTPNNAAFSISPGYAPIAAVQNIIVSSSQSQGLVAMPPNWNSNPLTLMQPSQAALFTIDTSTPFLSMPPEVCDAFASALNLTYDTTLQLYRFANNTSATSSPQSLDDWNLSFTFTLADTTNSTSRFELPISYNAFNLQLSYGFPGLNINYGDPAVNYFPLRRANSSAEYTIGRAFLQETYLIVDYERQSFSLSSAILPDINTVLPQIVAITRPAGSTWPGPQIDGGSSLSAGAKAGIGVGVASVFIAIVAVVLFFVRQRRKAQGRDEKASTKKWWRLSGSAKKPATPTAPVSELLGDRRHPRELLVDSSNTRFELPGHAPIEMPADDVPGAYLAAHRASDQSAEMTNNPTHAAAVGLTNHSSIRKDYNIREAVTERSSSPVPPYSPSAIGHGTNTSSDGVSPYNSRLGGGYGSHTSSGSPISPIVQYGTQTQSIGNTSPVSPQVRASQTMFSSGNSSDSPDSSQSATLQVLPQTMSRTASHNSRFREELADDPTPTSETHEEHPQLRPRFSWEQ